MIKCAGCNKNPAIMHPTYGPTWCKSCLSKRQPWNKFKFEFMPQRIKDERVENFKHMVQPWRQGEASKEYIEQHPDKAKKMYSEKEIKKAKYVWKGIKGWNEHYGYKN